MDGLPLALPFLLGVLLRLGIPLLLTYGATWLLRRLDRRWQSEADELRAAGLGKRAPLSLIRCWILNDCPPERREACPVYQQRDIPCWQYFRDERGRLAERCLDCQVFRRSLVPETI